MAQSRMGKHTNLKELFKSFCKEDLAISEEELILAMEDPWMNMFSGYIPGSAIKCKFFVQKDVIEILPENIEDTLSVRALIRHKYPHISVFIDVI